MIDKERVPCLHCGGLGHNLRLSGPSMRAARLRANLSLREVARATRYSPAYISDIELGRRTASEKIEEFYEQLDRVDRKENKPK